MFYGGGSASMYSASEVRRLADVYSGAKKRRLSTISVQACGNWASLGRLAEGKAMRSDTLERAGQWFDQNWPSGVPWPLSSPRPNGEPPKKKAGGSSTG